MKTLRRQPGETNLDDGGELREGCLRNRFEMGQIMAFWFWQRPCRARAVLWLWQLVVHCRSRESKMEIPVSIVSREGTVKKLISAIAILLFTGAAACGPPPNLLIGTWKLDRSGAAPSQYCAEPLTYTSKTATTPDYAGSTTTIRSEEHTSELQSLR